MNGLLALIVLTGCGEQASSGGPPSPPVPTLRADGDFEYHRRAPAPLLSADGERLLVFDVDDDGITPFLAAAGSPVLASAQKKFRYDSTAQWRGLDANGDSKIVIRRKGEMLRQEFDPYDKTTLGTLKGKVAWVEPLWQRNSLLIAESTTTGGLEVREWSLTGASNRLRFRSETADDVVFDSSLKPRFAFERVEERHRRGLHYDRVQVTDPKGRALGDRFLQVEWIEDKEPAPRVGDGPVHMLGGGESVAVGQDLSGLGLVDNRGWTSTWLPRWADATTWLVSPGGSVSAVAEDDERLRWTAFDDDGEALTSLQKRLAADVRVLQRSTDDRTWLLKAWSGSSMDWHYVWDRDADTLVRVGAGRGRAGELQDWRPVEPFALTARDGLRLAAYLTRPDAAKYGPAPWPLVVQVHGGPWTNRHSWRWSEDTQRLADQGYAALAVNFRGTRGWGWNLINTSGFGDTMILDVEDALRWAVNERIADPARIAMVGTSYGGYATLKFATAEHSLIRCGVAGATSGKVTMEGGGLNLYAVKDAAWREAHSPDLFTHRMSGPVLVWTGGKDGTNLDSIASFVNSAEANGKTVTWVRFPEQGHYLSDPKNRAVVGVLTSRFLAGCLGGPSRPIGTAIEQASVEIRAGAAAIDGLQAAWAHKGAGSGTPAAEEAQ